MDSRGQFDGSKGSASGRRKNVNRLALSRRTGFSRVCSFLRSRSARNTRIETRGAPYPRRRTREKGHGRSTIACKHREESRKFSHDPDILRAPTLHVIRTAPTYHLAHTIPLPVSTYVELANSTPERNPYANVRRVFSLSLSDYSTSTQRRA